MPILNTAQNDLTTWTRALYLPLRNPNFCSEGLPVLYTANYRWPHFALTVATRYPVICVDSDYTSLPPTQASLHGARTTKLKTIDSIRSEDYLSAYLSLRPTHIKNDRTSPSAVVFLYRRTDYSTPTITEVALMIA